jgi:hypothetical protein
MIEKEEVKRLAPKNEVTRELYLKSGNICAFPGCSNIMIDDEGNFIGQICHIEAAEDGGERFNENMSNEDRRSFENLMLMCYEHHVITNDIDKYTVGILKEMKKKHEDKFSGIIQRIQNSVVDYGKVETYQKSILCKELARVLNWKSSDSENIENSKILNELIEKLKNLPIETRKIFSIMVDRSSYNQPENKTIIALHEIEFAIVKDSSYILKHLDILERKDLVSEHYLDDHNRPYSRIINHDTGWNYWKDILEFCRKKSISLDEVIVNVNFSVFD